MQYSNITMVTTHNAAFVQPNNAASNQLLGIRDQLDDGVRMSKKRFEQEWNSGG
jgi:hypothetical protein